MTTSKDLELINTIRLIRSENIGVKTFWSLLKLYKTATIAIDHIKDLSSRGGKIINVYDKEKAEDEIATCLKQNVKILHFQNPDFPNLLKNIDDCPPLLFCLGNASLLNKSSISIVGSRNASANGLRFAYKLASELSKNQKIIISGFARGIDNAAHKASIDHGTVAVLAGGVDHIYPPEYANLYHEVIEKGAIVAELPLGSIPKSQNFPQRNRIISGISCAVAVIEASLKSGSLITAKYAIEQNKELFVVPGFPLDPRYQGNNYLLKTGAYLLESAQDILEALENSIIKQPSLFEENKSFLCDHITNDFGEKELTQARIEIINLVSTSPTSIDEIVNFTQLSVGLVLTIVVELELSGKITRHFGNKISITI